MGIIIKNIQGAKSHSLANIENNFHRYLEVHIKTTTTNTKNIIRNCTRKCWYVNNLLDMALDENENKIAFLVKALSKSKSVQSNIQTTYYKYLRGENRNC